MREEKCFVLNEYSDLNLKVRLQQIYIACLTTLLWGLPYTTDTNYESTTVTWVWEICRVHNCKAQGN